jgi:Pyridoxamine 5'-phosphate oxidase
MATTGDIDKVGPAFIAMAHRIVWATVATADAGGRPRSRVLHPIWERTDDGSLVGWIATSPTPLKRAHLAAHPNASVTYWAPDHDTCTAECDATWYLDDETRVRVWEWLKATPLPLGYDPAIIPAWADGPRSSAFAVLRLDPWRLRVLPGSLMGGGTGELLVWRK